MFRPKLWPWNDPLSLFFLLSHKLLRLLLPFCLMLAFIANSVVIWLPETPMIMYVLLGGQVLFVCAAGLGYVSRSARGIWRFPRVIWFIANGYLSTLRGFAAYLSGAQTVLWERAER